MLQSSHNPIHMKYFHRRIVSRGFTLIELLVVIAIIGILATVVLISLNKTRSKAQDARVMSDVKQIRDLLEGDFSGASYPDLTNVTPMYGGFAPSGNPGSTTLSTLISDAYGLGGSIHVVVNPSTDPVTSYAVYGSLISTSTIYDCLDSAGGSNQISPTNNTSTCP